MSVKVGTRAVLTAATAALAALAVTCRSPSPQPRRSRLHACGVNPGGPCNETQGRGNARERPGAACRAGFHACVPTEAIRPGASLLVDQVSAQQSPQQGAAS
jgi:hypothetical protein